MWDLIVSVPNHCLSFCFSSGTVLITGEVSAHCTDYPLT